MVSPTDANSRNRLISKSLDVGRRNTDATSSEARDAHEAVESTIHSFAQAPSSADKLRNHQGPLDSLLQHAKSEGTESASQPPTAEDIIIAAEEAGESPSTIDGNLGPKTLEARNLFQQEQVDALKIQSNNLPNTFARNHINPSATRQTRLAIEGVDADKQELSSLTNTASKTVDETANTNMNKKDGQNG